MSSNQVYNDDQTNTLRQGDTLSALLIDYLVYLTSKRKSPATRKVVRHDVHHFLRWWETQHHRAFDLAGLRHEDLRDWQLYRQRDVGAAPATINRGMASLRGFCHWAIAQHLLADDPSHDLRDIPIAAAGPRSLPTEAVDRVLRIARAERDAATRLRNEALLALLVYGGLRVQELCDIQLRDLDLAGGTVTIRNGKAGKARRIPLHADAQRLLQRYLDELRCPDGMPMVGSEGEREVLLMRHDRTLSGHPWKPGITQRLAQRLMTDLCARAAQALRTEAHREPDLITADRWRNLARQLAEATPHTFRHSLARRMLGSGAQLPEVQRILGHSRLSTTGIYLTPSEEDVRIAINRAGI